MIAFKSILHPTNSGLYCPPGDFYIDPVRKVDRAVITHGHADHARAGHGAVLATAETINIMAARYGADFTGQRQSAKLGEVTDINGVKVSFAPAGHILGSAQAVVEYKGVKLVCTGDFKRRPDPTCPGFEVVPCHVFISEATFGLPVFQHPDDWAEVNKLLSSLTLFPDRVHLVGVYALGKAQRVIRLLREAGYCDTIYIQKALTEICGLYEDHGIDLGPLASAELEAGVDAFGRHALAGKLVLGPTSSLGQKWASRISDPVIAFCSGWMGVRRHAKRSGVELPLILSDHADWRELTQTVRDVNPEALWVTHGREDALCRWADLNGFHATPLRLVGLDDLEV